MIFPRIQGFYFNFYKKGEDGKIDWERSSKRIKASASKEEISRAAKDSLKYSHEVSFRTEKVAPEYFDGWTFKWKIPKIDKNAELYYAVLLQNGEEHYTYYMKNPKSGRLIKSQFLNNSQSDFINNKAEDGAGVFFGRHISINLRVTKGKMIFSDLNSFYFTFCRRDKEGNIQRAKPIATIKAVSEYDQLEEKYKIAMWQALNRIHH